MWRINNMLINTNGSLKKSKRKSKKSLETNENGSTMIQNLWKAAKAVLREKSSAASLRGKKEKEKKTPNKQSYLTPKEKRKRNKTQK